MTLRQFRDSLRQYSNPTATLEDRLPLIMPSSTFHTPNLPEKSVEPVQQVDDSTSPAPRQNWTSPEGLYPEGRTPASLAFKAGLDLWRKAKAKNKTPKPEDESENAGDVPEMSGSDHESRGDDQKDGGKSVP
jgi:hypothetical protein